MDFKALDAAYKELKTGTLWHNPNLGDPKHPCKGYADANPGEASAIDTFVAALVAGKSPTAPTLATATGKGLVDLIRAGLDVIPQPPSGGLVITAPQAPLTLMDGGMTKDSAIFSRDTGSPDISHLHVKNYTGYGIGQMAWSNGAVASTGTSKIHDIIAENISANPPRSKNGTAEACFWLGQRTEAYNLVARKGAWMDMWTGADCIGSYIHDFELLDAPLVALYCEHQTQRTTFKNFRIVGLDANQGGVGGNMINIEWWYGGKGSKDLVFDNFEIYVPAGRWAIFGDAGTCGVEIAPTQGKIYGPGNGIIMPTVLQDSNKPNKIHTENIDFSGLAGTHTATHNNKMGTTFADHAKALKAGELHPDTFRMPTPFSERMELLHASLS